VTVAQPVPEPVDPAVPGPAEVLRRGTEVGFGALGLAGRAAGSLLGRVPTARRGAPADPAVPPVALLPGAVAGMAIAAERVAQIVVDEVMTRSVGVARVVTRPRVVRWSLRPVEDALWRFNEIARREQERNQAEAAAFMPVLIQRVTENVIAQIDFVRVVQQVPVDEIVANLDIEAIVARVDLVGVIRESTASVTSEATDALREQGMTLDLFTAKLVDRLLFRKRPRELDVGATP
jgi:hypothetical protein